MTPQDPRSKRQRAVVLPLVLILSLILTAAVTTFQRRAVIDTTIVRNRDRVAFAEALARSGIHIARAVLHEQLQRKIDVAFQRGDGEETLGNTEHDLAARIGDYELETPEGAFLRVSIFDNHARLNLNALVPYASAEKTRAVDDLDKALQLDELGKEIAAAVIEGLAEEEASREEDGTQDPEAKQLVKPADDALLGEEEGKPIANAEEFLVDFLDRVIENMRGTADEKEYIPRELAQNLIDYMDRDLTRINGGDEATYYKQQNPPYLPANRPLLSVQELGLIEGFDHKLVTTLEPYLTVYPLFAAQGVNINTAPGHVLGSIYQGSGASLHLLGKDQVVAILEARERGEFFCDDTASDSDRCLNLDEVDISAIYPPTELPAKSWVYTVLSQVNYGDIERNVEAVINMTQTGKDMPFLLYWRMQ